MGSGERNASGVASDAIIQSVQLELADYSIRFNDGVITNKQL